MLIPTSHMKNAVPTIGWARPQMNLYRDPQRCRHGSYVVGDSTHSPLVTGRQHQGIHAGVKDGHRQGGIGEVEFGGLTSLYPGNYMPFYWHMICQ